MSGPQCCENPPSLSSSRKALTPTTFILLAADIYGYEAPKLRKLADKIGAAGFYIVVSDFFGVHRQDKGTEDAKPVIADLKAKGIYAIGAAGFCWVANAAVKLLASDHIQAAVLLHPSFVC